MPGPIPKRTAERRRRNKPAAQGAVPKPATAAKRAPRKTAAKAKPAAAAPATVAAPPALEHWADLAREWYESLAKSGMAKWFQPSDWAQARVLAETLHRNLTNKRGLSAQSTIAWLQGAAELGTTEGARRRMRIELEAAGAEPEVDPVVVTMADYRRKVGKSK